MITSINTNQFVHQESVIFNGEIHYSSYNHNYYTSEDGRIILEESDDDCTMSYWWVNPNTGETEWIGIVESDGYGIFNADFDGYPYRNNDGIIEIDSDFC